jgi:hypothetical protein
MATGKPLTIYALVGEPWCYLFHPLQSNRVLPAIDLVRQNYYTLRLQAVRTTDVSLSNTGTVTTGAVDLSAYDDVIFGMKSTATATDYSAAWRGFNTGDTAWHSLANGRFSIDVAPTTALTVQQYLGCAFRLIDGSTSYLDVPDLPLTVNLRQNLITGSEPSTPSGTLSGNVGTATVLAGNDSVTVTDAAMTATGLIIPYFYGSAPASTIAATAASGSFVITLGGPALVNTAVGYYIVRRST